MGSRTDLYKDAILKDIFSNQFNHHQDGLMVSHSDFIIEVLGQTSIDEHLGMDSEKVHK